MAVGNGDLPPGKVRLGQGYNVDGSEQGQENGNTSTDENGYVKFTGMFDLTKYDMTDAITLYVDYNGEKAEIVLEKVGEE